MCKGWGVSSLLMFHPFLEDGALSLTGWGFSPTGDVTETPTPPFQTYATNTPGYGHPDY